MVEASIDRRKTAFLESYAETGEIEKSAKAVFSTREAVYKWRGRDEKFKQTMDELTAIHEQNEPVTKAQWTVPLVEDALKNAADPNVVSVVSIDSLHQWTDETVFLESVWESTLHGTFFYPRHAPTFASADSVFIDNDAKVIIRGDITLVEEHRTYKVYSQARRGWVYTYHIAFKNTQVVEFDKLTYHDYMNFSDEVREQLDIILNYD